MPTYYRPMPSIKNRNNYFPQSEELGADKTRITFMGSNPFPPRLSQAGTCIMVDGRKISRLTRPCSWKALKTWRPESSAPRGTPD